MHFRDYLRLTGQSVHGFALKHKLQPSTLNRLANGRTFPSMPILEAIVTATGGAVTANDFYEAAPKKGRAA